MVVLLAMLGAGLAGLQVLLDGDVARARLADAVRRATGRELTIAGPIRLAWSLAPTIALQDVSLLNPPGMSRPATAHADSVEAEIALAPLLTRRLEIRRIRLAGADVKLERDAEGRPNWLLRPPEAPPQPATPAQAPAPDTRLTWSIGAVELAQTRLAWRGGDVPLDATAQRIGYAPDSGSLDGALSINGVPATLGGSVHPAGAFTLNLVGGGLAASVAGTLQQATATVLVPDLAALAPLAGRALPGLRDLRLTATLAASGPSNLRLEAGTAAFGAVRLIHLDASAPSLLAPLEARATVQVGRLPIALAANAGSLAGLIGPGPVPVQLLAETGDSSLSAQGTVQRTGPGMGAELAVTGRVPDLLRLGWLVGVAVPPLRELALETRLATAPGAVLLRGLRLTTAQGDLAGDLAVGLQPRPSLRGSLVAQRLQLDGALVPIPPPAAAVPAPSPSPSPSPAPASPPPAAAPVRVAEPLLPATELPFAALRAADADLHLAVAETLWAGLSFRGLDARLQLQDGRLRLDPATARGPGGPVRLQLLADAAARPPTLAATATAPGLPAAAVLATLGAPETTKGGVDLDLDLRGAGETVRAVAATLDGHLGLAMVDGEVDNHWLELLFADALRAASLPIGAGGISRVRCAALRADAASGAVRLRALAIDTTRLKLDGEGGLNLRDETLDLHLRPVLRLGAALSVPVRVGGGFRTPKVGLDPGAIAPGRVGVVIGGGAQAESCGPALAAARNGQPGPSPSTPEPPSRPSRPADLLRGLLR